MLETGVKGEQHTIVTQELTAKSYGSGGLDVFATPAMIALMEKTCLTSVAPFLSEGESTVGTALDVRHVSASPVGMRIRCESILTGVDRRRLTFQVRAFDDAGLIGEGTHERFIVNNDAFMEKANAKNV